MIKKQFLTIIFACLGFTVGTLHQPTTSLAAIGCDPAVLEQGQAVSDSLLQQSIEQARALITQPTPIEQLSCQEQHTEVMNQVGGISSNPGGDISGSIGPLIQEPLMDYMAQFTGSNLAGSLADVINSAYSDIASGFLSGLGGASGGLGGLLGGSGGVSGVDTNCDMMDQAWLISQCIEMPELPNLSDMLSGPLADIAGVASDLATSPERAIEQICQRASGMLGDYMADLTGSLEGAAEAISTPITDSAANLNSAVETIGN